MATSKRREENQPEHEAVVVEPTEKPNDSPRDNQPAHKGQTSSSQSTNSDVPSEQIAKTLSRVDENMYNMAELLGQIWQRVQSGGKTVKGRKRPQEENNSSESEQDDYTAKRRRVAHGNDHDDSLSVEASEDEVGQLLSDGDTASQNDGSSAPDVPVDDLLQQLEAQFSEDKSIGPAIGEKLANIATKRWAEKLSLDKLKELHEKYKQPLNCEAMRVSRINPEIWAQLSQHKRKTDLRLSKIQQNTQKAVFATLQMAENLSGKSRTSPTDDKGSDREALLRIAVNLIAMLGHLNADVMTMRQESIKPALRPEFQKICYASIPPNSEFLFGDDLAKLVRDSKETNHIANTLTKAPRNGASNTNRRHATTYSRDSREHNSFTGENRGRRAPARPFLLKGGQKPYRRRPHTNNNGPQNQLKK